MTSTRRCSGSFYLYTRRGGSVPSRSSRRVWRAGSAGRPQPVKVGLRVTGTRP